MLGERIGAYRVVRKLGEGGMGVVYVGEHVELGHSVAIKLLLGEMSRNEEIVQRFFNEARAATRIRNPGIVQVHDFGYHAGGSAYFVMELLDGESLAARLSRGPLPIAQACGIARQIANALQAAHAQGIVHRDLKPDNVYLTPDSEVVGGERIKILDFGIAKLASDQGVSVKTRTGAVMGTPYYMSPEQCRGAGEVDARADVYSLGCILFEMLCGRPPFTGAGVGEILGQHQFVAAPSVVAFHPQLPPALVQLVDRTLAKAPEHRPQTMLELARALEPFSARGESAVWDAQGAPPHGAPVDSRSAPTPWPTDGAGQVQHAAPIPTAPRGGGGRSTAIVIGAVVAVAAIAGVVLAVSSSGGDEPRPTVAAAEQPAAVVVDAGAMVVPADATPETDADPDKVWQVRTRVVGDDRSVTPAAIQQFEQTFHGVVVATPGAPRFVVPGPDEPIADADKVDVNVSLVRPETILMKTAGHTHGAVRCIAEVTIHAGNGHGGMDRFQSIKAITTQASDKEVAAGFKECVALLASQIAAALPDFVAGKRRSAP